MYVRPHVLHVTMHMVIRVVVEAHDVESAVSNAERFFTDNLHYKNGGPFDYCTPMVEGHTVSGADRWIDYQDKECAFPLASDAGRAEVEDAWSITLDCMEQNLKSVWESMEEADDFAEFFETILDDEDLVRHRMSKVAGYQSTDYFLYVQNWSTSGLRSRRGWDYLQDRIEDAEENEDNRWWVVPLDVHY